MGVYIDKNLSRTQWDAHLLPGEIRREPANGLLIATANEGDFHGPGSFRVVQWVVFRDRNVEILRRAARPLCVENFLNDLLTYTAVTT